MAQASGLPVLVPNTGAHRESMLHATTGFLCRTGSEHDFASRASELLSNAPRRLAMGVSAAAYAKTRPWASTLESLFEAYRDAAHRTAAPRELTAIGPRAA